jgi:hypothetical protein
MSLAPHFPSISACAPPIRVPPRRAPLQEFAALTAFSRPSYLHMRITGAVPMALAIPPDSALARAWREGGGRGMSEGEGRPDWVEDGHEVPLEPVRRGQYIGSAFPSWVSKDLPVVWRPMRSGWISLGLWLWRGMSRAA